MQVSEKFLWQTPKNLFVTKTLTKYSCQNSQLQWHIIDIVLFLFRSQFLTIYFLLRIFFCWTGWLGIGLRYIHRIGICFWITASVKNAKVFQIRAIDTKILFFIFLPVIFGRGSVIIQISNSWYYASMCKQSWIFNIPSIIRYFWIINQKIFLWSTTNSNFIYFISWTCVRFIQLIGNCCWSFNSVHWNSNREKKYMSIVISRLTNLEGCHRYSC